MTEDRATRIAARRAALADKWVVRSMSTTDSVRGSEPSPYHVYLMPSHKRSGAYWTSSAYEAQLFDSPQAAEAEVKRWLPHDGEYGSYANVVPALAAEVPTYWEIQDLNRAHRASK